MSAMSWILPRVCRREYSSLPWSSLVPLRHHAGTGIWAIEFGLASHQPFRVGTSLTRKAAQEYPGANVIGTDLSPIQPELYANPPASQTRCSANQADGYRWAFSCPLYICVKKACHQTVTSRLT